MRHSWSHSWSLRRHFSLACVPSHESVTDRDLQLLQTFVSSHSRILVLTGAGISTESGIPDYRSAAVGLYARNGHKPVLHQQFVADDAIRRRYWTRNFLAWTSFSGVSPNAGHVSLARWERLAKTHWLVTQNVDRLHQRAGTERVTELHGNAYAVRCLSCPYTVSRFLFQRLLAELNPHVIADRPDSQTLRPDGDVDVSLDHAFRYPSCPRCDGILKPDIVFFGDNVPKSRVDSVYGKLDESDALLVIGSSLQVYSGYRFALSARESGKPVAVVNIGPTRADSFDNILKISARAGDILPKIEIY